MRTRDDASQKNYLRAAIAIVIIGIILRFAIAFFVMPSGDSCWHLNIGRYIAQHGEIPLFEQLGRDIFARPPLFHIIASIFYTLFSPFGEITADKAMNFVSPFFGSLTLVFLFFITRELLTKRQTFFAMFFASFFPLHLYFSTISHIESTLTFFVVLSFFLLIRGRFYLSAVSAGLAFLAKENGPFLLPIILFYLWQRRDSIKNFAVRSVKYVFVALIVASPWYLRNSMFLGNPIWPMLRFLFPTSYPSMEADIAAAPTLGTLLMAKENLVKFYLGLFGIPEGNSAFFSLFPFAPASVYLWIAASMLFLIPVLMGMIKKTDLRPILFVWAGSFLAVLFIFSLFSGFYARLFLPGTIALAFFFGIGMDRIPRKFFTVSLLLFCIVAGGFAFGEIYKAAYASSLWKPYQADYRYARENTDSQSLFFALGVCSTYYLNRQVYLTDITPAQYPLITYENLKEKNVSYAFVHPDFIPSHEGRLPEALQATFEADPRFTQVYHNDKTSTRIYQLQ